ncbi:hypothetical protein Ae201684P_005521 [Aphanomyces euteiches]|nr:hypothetical protein Ae201684P_005521 [Aphanomyces euteiches]
MRVTFVGLVLAAAVFLSGETTAYEYPAEYGDSQEWSGRATSHRRSDGTDLSHFHSFSSSGEDSPSYYYIDPYGSRYKARRQGFFKRLGRKIKNALSSKVAGVVSKVANVASKFIPVPGARMAVKAATTNNNLVDCVHHHRPAVPVVPTVDALVVASVLASAPERDVCERLHNTKACFARKRLVRFAKLST